MTGQGLVYGGALLVSIGCMVLLDHRFRLFFFADAVRAAVVLAVGVVVLAVVDVVGITQGIFVRGEGPWMSGVLLAPHFPLEEVGFLVLLGYVTMNAYAGARLVLERRAA